MGMRACSGTKVHAARLSACSSHPAPYGRAQSNILPYSPHTPDTKFLLSLCYIPAQGCGPEAAWWCGAAAGAAAPGSCTNADCGAAGGASSPA